MTEHKKITKSVFVLLATLLSYLPLQMTLQSITHIQGQITQKKVGR
jgi:hypothetical protein